MEKASDKTCPGCDSPGLEVFYEVRGVPSHSVMVFPTEEEAVGFPRGDIALGYCKACGFISNTAYDEKLQKYSARCEETQGYSATFREFEAGLAEKLIAKHDLHGRDLIEIGCGKGEFLSLMCGLGGNRGVGFDPAFVAGRTAGGGDGELQFVPDYYSEKYAHVKGDFIICKMTLEHISRTGHFMRTIRKSLGDGDGSTLFFQVPDVMRIVRERAFWDVYYEHCSYFSPGSLKRLFHAAGFEVTDSWVDYDGQYLMVEGRVRRGDSADMKGEQLSEPDVTAADVREFAASSREMTSRWRQKVASLAAEGRKTVIWGSGSKAVAFFSALGTGSAIRYVVDINPHKQDTYMPGTGQRIVAPSFLPEYQPDAVIIMNPVYEKEIGAALQEMNLTPQLHTVLSL